jgi:RNA polymerase sigma-70 factor, ECF subfamily
MTNDEHATQTGTAIEALYRAQHGPLLAYLARLVGDYPAAEDLCHETFLKAFRSWGQQAEVINPNAWLRRIATNTAYDYLRRHRRIHFASLDEDIQPPSGAESMESRLHEQEPVRRVLALLSPQARRLLLCASAGHSTGELAAALECSDTAVRLRLFRARRQFRQAYCALDPENTHGTMTVH